MKKLKVLSIIFDTRIKQWEISSFRSAVIEQTGRKYDLFHNHTEEAKSIYRYPLIQYKMINSSPAIVCLGDGTDQIYRFFENKGEVIILNGEEHKLEVKNLKLNQFTMQVWNTHYNYNIENWIALNEENYSKYIKLENLTDKIDLLEKTLTANLLAFAKGIDWNVDKSIELKIVSINHVKTIKIKNNRFTTFNLTFKTNVFIPNYIGLGKSVSKGFGVVTEKK